MPAESAIQSVPTVDKEKLKQELLRRAEELESKNPNLKLIDRKTGTLLNPASPEAKTNKDGTPVIGIHPITALVQQTYKDLSKPPTAFQGSTISSTRARQPSATAIKDAWVTQRASSIQAEKNISGAQARIDAELEYEQQMMKPLKPSFGDYGDRTMPTAAGLMPQPVPATGEAPATFATALRPQAYMGEGERISEKKRQDVVEGTSAIAGSRPFDFKKLRESLVKAGASEEEADSLIDGYRATYNKQYQIYKDPKKAWEATVKIVDSIKTTLDDKKSYIKDPTKETQVVDITSALSPQTKAGEAIPNWNDDQITFLRSKIDSERKRAKLKVAEETPPPVKITSNLRGDISNYREMTEQEKEAWREKRVQELVPPQIFENDEKLKQVREGTAEFEPGLLEDRNPFGGTRETTTGWLLRSVAAPWNAAMGAIVEEVPELTYGFYDSNATDAQDIRKIKGEEQPSFAQEMRGKEKKEGRYSNPVLANVAEGKGLGGEFAEAAQTMWGDDTTDAAKNDLLFQVLKGGYVAGGYAADILDPTFEIAGALGAGAKIATRYARAAGAVAKVGEEASLASKAAKGASIVAESLAYGGKEFAKDLAREAVFGLGSEAKAFAPGDVRSTIATKLSAEYRTQAKIKAAIESGEDVSKVIKEAGLEDSAFAKAYRSELPKHATPQEAYNAIAKSDEAAKMVDDSMQAIDDLLKGQVPVKAREKDIARQMAILSRDNPGVYNALKAVDNLKPQGSKIVAYAQELGAKNIDALRQRVINDIARKEVYKATAKQAGFDNVIQLTRNTFTTKAVGNEILAKAASSDIGKVANELKKSTPRIIEVPTERGAFVAATAPSSKLAAAVDLTAEQISVVEKTLQQLVGLKVFPQDSANIIRDMIRTEGAIPLQDLRKILDAEIDLIAEAQPTIVRARDMNLLSDPQKTERLLQPIETKHFGSNLFIDFVTKYFNDIQKTVEQTVSPAQRTIAQQAMQKAANLDNTLRTSMSNALNDSNFRKAYGMPADSKPSRQTALAYLIAGPEVGRTSANIEEVLNSAIQSSIFEKTSKEAIFDQITGAKTFRDNSIFNKEGHKLIQSVVEDAAKKIINNPSELWNEMGQVAEFANNLSRDKAYLKNSVDESKITRVITDKIPGEIQVGAFYRAEMDRIAKESLQELVSGPAKVVTPNIRQSVSPAAKDLISRIRDAETARLKGLADNFLFSEADVQALKQDFRQQAASQKALREESKTLGQAIKEEKKQVRLTADEKRAELKDLIKNEDLRLKLLNLKEERATLRATSKAQREQIKAEAKVAREELKATYKAKRAEVARGVTQRTETLEAMKLQRDKLNLAKSNLKQEDISRIEKVIADQPIESDLIGDLVTLRLAKNISGEDVGKLADMSIDDIIKTLPDSWKKAGTAVSKDELLEVIVAADEAARTIQIANKIPPNGSIDDISESIAKYFQDPKLEEQAKLFFGPDIYKQINENIGQGGSRLNKALEDIVARSYGPDQSNIKKFLAGLYSGYNSFFYTLMLTAATRFHGGNILGAPGILYKTLGATGLRSLYKLPDAILLMKDAKSPLKGNLSKVIVTDPAGRAFTKGEVYSMLSEIGTPSQFSRGEAKVSSDLVRLVSDNLGARAGGSMTWISRAAEAEDMTFRAAVLLKALEEGRGADEAVKLSRAALYDVGDVGNVIKAEKDINSLILFYNFARNNLINTIELLTSAKGQARIQKYSRFAKMIEGTPFGEKETVTSKEKAMMSEYAQSRIILDTLTIGKDDKQEKYAIAYAPDAMLDSLNVLSAIAEGEIMDKILGMTIPSISEAIAEKEGKEYKKIDPEIVALLNLTSEDTRKALISLITGSDTITPIVVNRSGKTEIEYPLDTTAERDRYAFVKAALNYIGASRIIQDYAKITKASGTSTARINLSPSEQLAYATAAITPLKIASAEKTAFYNTLAQTEEGKKFVKDIDKLFNQRGIDISEEGLAKARTQQAITGSRTSTPYVQDRLKKKAAQNNYIRYLQKKVLNEGMDREFAKKLAREFQANDYVEPASTGYDPDTTY